MAMMFAVARLFCWSEFSGYSTWICLVSVLKSEFVIVLTKGLDKINKVEQMKTTPMMTVERYSLYKGVSAGGLWN